MGYQKYRVKSPIKSFRDLEVYQVTTGLSAEFFNHKLPQKYSRRKEITEEYDKLRELSKYPPRLIVEAYNDKFNSLEQADQKMEQAMQMTNTIIAKIDFLCAVIEDDKFKEILSDCSARYQKVRVRILNLKRSWQRVFGKK